MSFGMPVFAIFGDIGAGEVLVILAAILILFGGKGLPTMARKLGKVTHDLQKAAHDFKKQLLSADQPTPPEPSQNTPVSPDHDADKP
jgi:sec-independent protein translocase protein TatA